MSLQAKVISVSDDKIKAKVKVKPVASCNGCKACAGLIKANKNSLKEQEITVLTNDIPIKENDIVTLELTEYQGSKAALILYGVPIIGFIGGMLISPIFCSLLATQVTDGARIIGALIGFVLSILFIALYLRKNKTETFMMHIASKISED